MGAFFLSLLLIPACLFQQHEPPKLAGSTWDIYKTKEVLVNSQNTYVRWYGDTTTVQEEEPVVAWYEDDIIRKKRSTLNVLGGHLKLNEDSKGKIRQSDILWSFPDSRTFHIERDTSGRVSQNNFFFGDFDIEYWNDSSAVLYKDLSGTGKWTRKFYLRRLED